MKDLLSDTDWHCRHDFKYENFTPLFGGLRRKTAAKSVPNVQHDYFSLFNRRLNSRIVAMT